MQKSVDKVYLEANKIIQINRAQDRLQEAFEKLTLEQEYNMNHYSMIENYMERYVPIHTQDAITDNLGSIMTPEQKIQFNYYLNERKKTLNAEITDKDDMADVIQNMNKIREELGKQALPTKLQWYANPAKYRAETNYRQTSDQNSSNKDRRRRQYPFGKSNMKQKSGVGSGNKDLSKDLNPFGL